MAGPDIAIIINSFNRLELLKKSLCALSSWLPQSEFRKRCHVVIFEAGSTDGSIEWIEANAPGIGFSVSTIRAHRGEDTSFAAGINAGVDFAKKSFPLLMYLLFYETDNQILSPLPLSEALTQLDQRPYLGACGFTVRQNDGSPAGVGMPFPRLINFLLGKNLVQKLQLEAIKYKWEQNLPGSRFSEVDVVFTSPLLIKIAAWNAAVGLDAAMFPFSDCEVDWARRLWQIGWRMGVIESDAVIHDNLNTISAWSKNRAMQFHRARLRYFKRYHPIAIFIIWPFLLLVRHSFELIAAKFFVKDFSRRNQLIGQFKGLLKVCLKSYE